MANKRNIHIPEIRIKARHWLALFFLPLLAAGQSPEIVPNPEPAQFYAKAIALYIKHSRIEHKGSPDTIYFLNRKNGHTDDFPEIKLPRTIEKTEIRLIDPEWAGKHQKEYVWRTYINLIGWIDKENGEFIFVVFSKGFAHLYDCYIDYDYNDKLKVYEFKRITFNDSDLNNSK